MAAPEAVASYVLHRHPYQESSLLVELFTAEHGRIGAVARGARRPRSSLSRLQPWQKYLVSWRGRGELVTLAQAEESGPILALSTLPTLCGFYLNELLLRLLARWDPHPALFTAYETALADLVAGREPDWVLRRFELELLQVIGFGPDLTHCRSCGKTLNDVAGKWYHFPQEGLYCEEHGAGRSGGFALNVPTLLQLQGAPGLPDAAERRTVKHWLRGELAPLLGRRPLQSQALLRAYWRGHHAADAACTRNPDGEPSSLEAENPDD